MAFVDKRSETAQPAKNSFISQVIQLRPVLIAVFLNIVLTLILWILVYKTEGDKESIAFYLLDTRSPFTTGDDLYDGFLNGILCVSALAILSFVMLGFALYDFHKIVTAWLTMSCLLVNYATSALIFRDTLKVVGYEENSNVLAALLAFVYGSVGCMVFFTSHLPQFLHQVYVVCNCSMVSVFYLRIFPNETAWFVLCGVIVWDIFAVLSPIGPLRKVTEKAGDYSEQVLRLLTFDAKTPGEVNDNLDTDSSHSSSSTSYSDLSMDTAKLPSVKGGRTAYDALQDTEMTRLGMGDFVFYSLLVGKAAASGNIFATINAFVGVMSGLIITLTILPECEETIPALPISIFLGLFFHFSTLYLLEPMSAAIIGAIL